ncbi:MAG: DsbC family protein, partial [Pseudomonadota bacterium]
AAVEAVLGHREEATLAQKPDCALEPLHRRLVTAQLIGMRGVPFMIRESDGSFVEGVPRDLPGWVEGAR